MCEIKFYKPSEISDDKLKFAVIMARYDGRWIFCRHRDRDTWEIPGGHREAGEAIDTTARRELFEETGALDADVEALAVYGVNKCGEVTYGGLFYARVLTLGEIPEGSEIGRVGFFDDLPERLTYPDIQPYLFDYVKKNPSVRAVDTLDSDHMSEIFQTVEQQHDIGKSR